MKEKLTNNLLLKVISVVAAFLLWMVVINIDNPTDTFIIGNIPVKILNEQSAMTENNLTYDIIGDKTVSVEVTARRTDRRKISADDFEATIDMNEIYGATGSVAVNITVVDNKTLIRSWTQITRSIQVNVEEIQRKEFDIQVKQEGNLEESYTVSEATVSPAQVQVTAPKSIMDTIDHAGVTVNVDGAVDNILAESEIKLYGAGGQVIKTTDERLKMNITTANVSVSVVKTNQISVDVKVTGQDAVADGYQYITYKCEPQTVSVTGAKALIASFDKLVFEEDLTGKSDNFTSSYRISDYLPEGLELAEGEPETIKIVFQIEKLTRKNFSIGRSQINLLGADPAFSYQIGEENSVIVTLEGLEEDLEKVTSRDISVSLDVSSIGSAGVHELEPQVKLTEMYESYFTVSAPRVRMIVVSSGGGTEPSEEETDTESRPSEGTTGSDQDREPSGTSGE